MYRTQRGRSEGLRLAAYAAAGLAAAALAGALLGLLGSLVPGAVRAALAVVLALAAICIALLELSGRRVPLVQIDRETPYGWLAPGPLLWAWRNGAALGFGARTRLGFWLWYAIPLGSFLAGSVWLGALGYGLYGLTRTLGVAGLLRWERLGRFNDVEVLRSSAAARTVTDVQLLALGIVAAIFVGA